MRYTYLLLSLLLLGCARVASEKEQIRPIKSVVATSADYIEKSFVGMATPLDAVNMAFKLSGQIISYPIYTGQLLREGEFLAELDPRDFELQLFNARTLYEQAQSQLNRTKRLLEREAISRQEYENSLAAYSQAKTKYENSKELLSQTTLYAPYLSVVERTYVDIYEQVQSGQAIVRLVKPETTTVSFTLPESSMQSFIDSTTRFSVTFDAYEGVSFPAVIKDYASTTSDASGFPASLTIENSNPARYKISPGISCTITMYITDDVSGAISLPLNAIYAPAEGGEYVWIVGNDNRVHLSKVSLGELYGTNRVIVNSGVKSGDRVASAGLYQLRNGDKVRILK